MRCTLTTGSRPASIDSMLKSWQHTSTNVAALLLSLMLSDQH